MPIYEYRCKKGHEFEVMQRMGDDQVTTCAVCTAPVERVFTPIAVHFKGSGFYSTDYGSKKRSRELKEAGEGTGKQAKEDGSSGGAKSESTSEGKSDGKSDSKSDAKAGSKSDTAGSTASKPGKSSSGD